MLMPEGLQRYPRPARSRIEIISRKAGVGAAIVFKPVYYTLADVNNGKI
jgi:hypothetical protein